MRARHALAALGLAAAALGAAAQGTYGVEVESRKEPDGHRVIARNGGRAAVELAFSLAQSTNLSSTRSWPFTLVLHPGETREAVRVGAERRDAGYAFSYRYAIRLGDPRARPDPGARYRLPFRGPGAYLVSQAPGGPLVTHTDAQSAHAIDIVMPEGTPIVAARAGHVIEIHQASATRADLAERGNYVRIYHDDHTWADYAHLSRTAPDLALGRRVDAGTLIGHSGNTGQSSGPHLHFHVQHNDGGRIVSIPVRFHTRTRGAVTPTYRGLLAADD
ncbi:MAG: M23 family metallopeptidase [Burkholderiales bacterium]|nr:M23 family metallopeptidase [Burkholderiales bacterium]